MGIPLSPDDEEESSGGKPNFVGRVVTSEAQSEKYSGNPEYRNEDSDYFDHLYEIEVIDRDWDNVHEFSLEVSNNPESKWMVLINHLVDIHGDLKANHGLETAADIAEFLEGRVYEFRELTFSEDEVYEYATGREINFSHLFNDSENAPNPLLVPVEEIDDPDSVEMVEEDDDVDIDDDVAL